MTGPGPGCLNTASICCNQTSCRCSGAKLAGAAAAGVALGASYGGKVALTVTSGPGMALKTEFLGLAIMTEIPLVVLDVQRGGPSTGLPTKVEQSDLLSSIFGQHGDARVATPLLEFGEEGTLHGRSFR